MFSACPHNRPNDELRSTNGWDRLASLGDSCKFQRVSRLGFVTAPTSLNGGQPNFARCLAIAWMGWYTIYIYILGALIRFKNHFASNSSVILYWQRYCTALEQLASAKLCGVVSPRDRAAMPFDIGRSNCLVCYLLARTCHGHTGFQSWLWVSSYLTAHQHIIGHSVP